MSQRSILHVDMDAFFAAVEVLDDPALAGKPVMVGGTPEGRGVVAAASYEARRYGVHSAMSAWQARKRCPHGIFLRPRFERYSEISKNIFDIFGQYTPLVEPISIDEAFLDVTGCERLFGPAVEIGRAIKRRIREEIGLTASVGVAPNKFLAKLASELEKPDGFVVIAAAEAAARLAPLPVSRLWGVGRVTERVLAGLGIRTVRQLLAFPEAALEARLGSYARHLRELAVGHDERPVVAEGDAKSMGAETTFAADLADAEALRDQLDLLADRVARRLRAEGWRARTIHLKARYGDFRTVTRARTLAATTAGTRTIRDAARAMLEEDLGRGGRALRLLGLSLDNFEREGAGQGELFPDEREARAERLDRLIDRLREEHGRDAIGLGSPSVKRKNE
jgi:DNA polymerase-4